jgi:dihydroorotate dehydrogenase
LPSRPLTVGGVQLPSPYILSAGFVKGRGFADEAQALQAVTDGVPIISGWRGLPPLLGPIEFGSFTPFPRLGNSGTVLWRHPPQRSLQNRIGLKNPGSAAAASFFARHRDHLPPCFGINLATSPGVVDPLMQRDQLIHAASHFIAHSIRPTWFTLNLSCPNTEDDPAGQQTEHLTRHLVEALVPLLSPTPLWVKLGPDLALSQYDLLLPLLDAYGVQAVIATNTLGQPAPDGHSAGMSGAQLFPHALRVVQHLLHIRAAHHLAIDIIPCGGVMDGLTAQAYHQLGVNALQYWSALVYRGPLAPALILDEYECL